jgi:hypothetical protein
VPGEGTQAGELPVFWACSAGGERGVSALHALPARAGAAFAGVVYAGRVAHAGAAGGAYVGPVFLHAGPGYGASGAQPGGRGGALGRERPAPAAHF